MSFKKNIFHFLPIVFAGQTLRNQVLADVSSSTLPSGSNFGDSSFYTQFPYQKPQDIFKYIDSRHPPRGDSKMMLNIMDDFAMKYPMYKLSKLKAHILVKEMRRKKPKHVLEIGSFYGYSAIHILDNLPIGSSLTCIEANNDNAEVARQIISRAIDSDSKLSSFQLLEGISSKVLQSPQFDSKLQYDFIFLDHDKDSYLSDLQTLETKGFIAANAVILADNVVYPGAPGYLEYVGTESRIGQNTRYQTVLYEAPFERIGFETQWREVPDAMSVSIYRDI